MQLNASNRIESLDILRGVTVCGMILVNNAGACGFGYTPLKHAKWDGFTPADLVFPMFMFIMGVSIYLSLSKHNFNPSAYLSKVLSRTVKIVLAGIVMHIAMSMIAEQTFDVLETLRIPGVLQRLGICYGIVAIMALYMKHRNFYWLIPLLLVGYSIILATGNGYEKCADNICAIVDNLVFTSNHIYLKGKQFLDPEGVLSTIPAVAQVMIGFICGKYIKENKDNIDRVLPMFILGTILLIIGYLWSYSCPLNKRLWTPSFTCVTCGVSALMLAVSMYVIDEKKKWKRLRFFTVVGINPHVIFLLSEILGEAFRTLEITTWSFEHLWQAVFGDYGGSLMYAIVFMLINWGVAYLLYRKNITIKL